MERSTVPFRAVEDVRRTPVLYYRGNVDVLPCPAVAIVGSRAGSAVALEMAERLATDLAARGIAVVSGLARGVDSAAHRGALTRGRTIAVLGSGVDVVYPSEHAQLAREIAASGLVLSELAPGTPPLPFTSRCATASSAGCRARSWSSKLESRADRSSLRVRAGAGTRRPGGSGQRSERPQRGGARAVA